MLRAQGRLLCGQIGRSGLAAHRARVGHSREAVHVRLAAVYVGTAVGATRRRPRTAGVGVSAVGGVCWLMAQATAGRAGYRSRVMLHAAEGRLFLNGAALETALRPHVLATPVRQHHALLV